MKRKLIKKSLVTITIIEEEIKDQNENGFLAP
jgi:hypothetical protein